MKKNAFSPIYRDVSKTTLIQNIVDHEFSITKHFNFPVVFDLEPKNNFSLRLLKLLNRSNHALAL